jgi:hypothetical protein
VCHRSCAQQESQKPLSAPGKHTILMWIKFFPAKLLSKDEPRRIRGEYRQAAGSNFD